MGVVIFILVEYVGMAYIDVAFAAFIPGFLYYAALLAMVHLAAKGCQE